MRRTACILGLAVWLLIPSGSGAAEFSEVFEVVTQFRPDGLRQKHPKKLTLTVVLPDDTIEHHGVCFGWVGWFSPKTKGRVKVTASVLRPSPQGGRPEVVQKVAFPTVKVPKKEVIQHFGRCKGAEPIVSGDTVEFKFVFKGFRAMSPYDPPEGRFWIDQIELSGSVQ